MGLGSLWVSRSSIWGKELNTDQRGVRMSWNPAEFVSVTTSNLKRGMTSEGSNCCCSSSFKSQVNSSFGQLWPRTTYRREFWEIVPTYPSYYSSNHMCSYTYLLYCKQERHSELFLLRIYQDIWDIRTVKKIKFNLIIQLFSFLLNHMFIFKAMK